MRFQRMCSFVAVTIEQRQLDSATGKAKRVSNKTSSVNVREGASDEGYK